MMKDILKKYSIVLIPLIKRIFLLVQSNTDMVRQNGAFGLASAAVVAVFCFSPVKTCCIAFDPYIASRC